MIEPPFEMLSCSRPRPVEQREQRWISEPGWNTPLMPMQSQPHWELFDD